MKVRATKLGYFGGKRVRVGEEFDCSQSEFSKVWMEKVNKPGRSSKAEKKEEVKVDNDRGAVDPIHADTFSQLTSKL